MKITNLSEYEFPKVIECLLDSFQNYFIKMPEDIAYWKKRFYHARVDFSLSYGVMDKNNLVGFIINAVDFDKKLKTAYNTGTGVIKRYRGNQWVDKMYQHSIPLLKASGIEQCKLEVVDKNYRAIKVYERIGFKKARRLKSYKGEISSGPAVKIKLLSLDQIDQLNTCEKYSWDFTNATVQKASEHYELYQVLGEKNNKIMGHFVINSQNGTVAQLECTDGNWEYLFSGIAWANRTIKINNIDESRIDSIHHLEKNKIPNVIDQFEMEMKI